MSGGLEAILAMELAPSESDLLERIRGGEREAAGLLYDRHRRAVFDLLVRRLRNVEEAEALCQEAFERSLRAAAEGRVRRFVPFLLQVARNLATDLLRKRGREVPLAELLDPGVPADPLRAELNRLADGIERLRPDLREVLLLHWRDDLSFAEIAGRLRMSKNGVHARHQRAMDALRAHFASARSSGEHEP